MEGREQVGNRHVLQKRQGSAHQSQEGGRKEKQVLWVGKDFGLGGPRGRTMSGAVI